MALTVRPLLDSSEVKLTIPGIDIDWQYPGAGTLSLDLLISTSEADVVLDAIQSYNLLMLLKEMRSALDAYGKEINATFLLSIAAAAGQSVNVI